MTLERFHDVQIPVYQIAANGLVYREKERILELLQENAKPENIAVESGDHLLIRIPATLPQHPEGSDVYWTAELIDGQVVSWDENSWQKLKADKGFLRDVHGLFHTQSTSHHVFMHVGHVGPELQTVPSSYLMSLQSVDYGHAHQTPKTVNSSTPLRFLDLTQEADLARMMIFLNLAGESSIADWDAALRSFSSHRIELKQRLHTQNNQDLIYPRTFFGFLNFQEALEQLFDLRSQIDPLWQEYALRVGQSTDNTMHIGPGKKRPVTPIRQSAVINALIVFPSLHEKQETSQVNDPSTVWIAPFALPSWMAMKPEPFLSERISK